MALLPTDRALLVKLFYQNGSSAATVLRNFRTLKFLRYGPMSATGLYKMIRKFEETGSLDVKPGRGRKPVDRVAVEDVATALQEGSTFSSVGACSARQIARSLDMPPSTVLKILRNIMNCYPYKLTHVQELLPPDRNFLQFHSQFLARMEVDDGWQWNIMWTNEAHFHLQSAVNMRRIWATENPYALRELPLHSPRVTVWCGLTAAFIVGPFFFEEVGPTGPITCTVNGRRYASLLRNHIVPALQQRQCLDTTIFMQDGAPPHIATQVKRLLRTHFGQDRIISRQFPTAWPARSPDLNPCDFRLWGHLKDVVFQGQPANLAELKARITHHIHSIPTDTLRSVHTPHAILRFQLVADQGGEHI